MKPINKQREDNIIFTEHNHKYTLKSNPTLKLTSVTQLISQFFHPFNAEEIIAKIKRGKNYCPGHKYWDMTTQQIKDEWERIRNDAAQKGTQLHKLIEKYLTTIVGAINDDRLRPFYDWLGDWVALGWDCVAVEMVVYDEEYKIAGSIDSLWYNSITKKYAMVDWKRSKKDIDPAVYYEYGIYPITHIPDNSYYKYSLQQNIYSHFLEKHYGIQIDKMYLVQFPPDQDKCIMIECPRLMKEVTDMLNLIKTKN